MQVWEWGGQHTAAELLESPECLAALVRDVQRRGAVLVRLAGSGQPCAAAPLDATQLAKLVARLDSDARGQEPHSAAAEARRVATMRVRRLGTAQGALLCRTGAEWHSDGVRAWTALYCVSNPANSGATLFADASVVLERLSPAEQEMAQAATAVYSSRRTLTRRSPSASDFEHGLRMNSLGTLVVRGVEQPLEAHHPEWRLPLVRKHPTRQSQGICIDVRHFDHLEVHGRAIDPAESCHLMDGWLQVGLGARRSAARWCPRTAVALDDDIDFDPAVVYRHRWRPGHLLIWDNDCVLHSPTASAPYADADADAGGAEPRELLQVIFPAPV